MAFELKVAFVSQDKSGRIITLRDSTGTGSGGYSPTGIPREFFLSQTLTFSRLNSAQVFSLKNEGNEWTYGKDIRIDSSLFSSNIDAAAFIFNDGILDVNLYNEVDGRSGVVITGGTNFITGGSFASFVDKDSVIVNDKIYQIDKVQNTNNNTVLYIIGTFETSATSFTAAYRSNIKVILRSVAFNGIALAYRNLLTQSKDQQEMYRPNLTDAIGFYEASLMFAQDGDYVSAQELILASSALISKLKKPIC